MEKSVNEQPQSTLKPEVAFCNWCPDPNNPDPKFHPSGRALHYEPVPEGPESARPFVPASEAPQVGGSHYRKAPGEQLWDRLVRLYGLPACRIFFVGNIMRYVERYQDKNGVQDLAKARHYIDKLIEEEGKHEARAKDAMGVSLLTEKMILAVADMKRMRDAEVEKVIKEWEKDKYPGVVVTPEGPGLSDEERKEVEGIVEKMTQTKEPKVVFQISPAVESLPITAGDFVPPLLGERVEEWLTRMTAPVERQRILCSRGCCFECRECSAKSGAPALCYDCLERRRLCNALWVEEKVMNEMNAVTPPVEEEKP